ncbi:aldehyde dehydrogenase [Frankia sp. AgB1.9]|uniref:aldehyde dehydrogenase n=1 Tax=unclassified Frankia TaxID=2632575 RepID=UPI0019349E98|nr:MULTISPECIES: aldehyde dehydrogenase [unclassified Frankia]MBL7489425.1 aldehyde dehydrogenase [Frankia sp. AgW1.1]MBL7550640.1 aldehyde dehydrogenase [Frankia sp. AgB1.9]MBL7620985.1 aldehyde dehydrogenase [Frankia sp. AgB1.8]
MIGIEPVRRTQLYIDGAWQDPATDEIVAVIGAATEEPVGWVPAGSPADVDAAVDAARRAFDEGPWPAMAGAERGGYLRRLAAALQPHATEIARTVASENGSPISWGTNSQAYSPIALFDYYGALADRECESTRPGRGTTLVVREEPVGVVGAIVPFNVPLMIAAAKIAPALAVGCTVVVKAPPEAPLSLLRLAEAAAEIGLPPGVLNVLTGGAAVGERLVRHRGVDKISFTGSTAVGARIASLCGADLRRVVLELGGKSASIVLDDADPAAIATGLLEVGITNNGQACAAASRVLVPRRMHDAVVYQLVSAVGDLVVGDPLDPVTQVGPLVSARQRDKVLSHIESGLSDGARVAVGGGRPAHLDRGWFVEPTVFTSVTNDMRIAQEEIFGPVLSVISYDGGDDEAVRIANDSPFGLAGSVWTTDPRRGLAVARRVRTGTFGINRVGIDLGAPFGGFKQSGIGREFGPEALGHFVELKTIAGVPD